jgi:hypothetical protein
MLHYVADIGTYREEVPARRRACELVLIQGRPGDDVALSEPWQKIWEGARPGDKDERFWLYRRPAKS